MDGATPLSRLPTAVVDLETTGLNVATDRIVQIGGIHMLGNKILPESNYNQLVFPGIKIDKKITKIHNIDDEKVKNAPTYTDCHLNFHSFLKNKIIVGFNIGFDLAIIRNECERRKIPVLEYRCLDVRLLGLILGIPQNTLYLESLAEYFSIDIKQRHDAYGDAFMTASILLHFIPMLRKRGLKTLGDVERESYSRSGFLSVSYSRDWYYPLPLSESPSMLKKQDWDELEKIDPFPFSHYVGEFMNTSLLSTDEDTSLSHAAGLMAENSKGSILVSKKSAPAEHAQLRSPAQQKLAKAKGKQIVGIFTERNLLNLIGMAHPDTLDAKLLQRPISDFMVSPVLQISQDAFIFQAIQFMVSKRVRHILVENNEGEICGIISQRDFLRTRLENFYKSQIRLEKVQTADELAEIHAEIPLLTRRLLKEELKVKKITQIISCECQAIVEQACLIAMKKMKHEKHGETAPAKFSVLILGSAGRGESMLAFDQDNAIIYEPKKEMKEKEKEIQQWFLRFGSILNDILNTAGIPYCKGKIMAGEKKWCRSLDSWKQQIQTWFHSPTPEAILGTDIFVDFIHAYGDPALTSSLRSYLTNVAMQNTTFLKIVGQDIINNMQAPLTMLGRIRSHGGWLDMKKNILFPIVATARLLALKTGSMKHNQTTRRYQYAKEKIKLNDYTIETLNEIHSLAMLMILEQQLLNISTGKAADNMVFLRLSKKRRLERFRLLMHNLPAVKDIIMNCITQ